MKFFHPLYLVMVSVYSSFALQFIHHEVFQYNHSLKDLVNNQFIENIKKNRQFDNLELKKNSNRDTLISYNSSKFGYPYSATYKIYEKTPDLYQIYYRNSFLKNDICLQKTSPNQLHVQVKVVSYLPIPKTIIKQIVQKNLHSLYNK